MRSVDASQSGVVLPVVLVMLAVVSASLGGFWHRVVHQAELTPIASLDDPSRAGLVQALREAQQHIATDPLSVDYLRGAGAEPQASMAVLRQSAVRLRSDREPVYTQWSAPGPRCPQREGSPEHLPSGASLQTACTERLGFTVWAGRAGLWPRYVSQAEWQLHWPAESASGAPVVRGPAVRVLR